MNPYGPGRHHLRPGRQALVRGHAPWEDGHRPDLDQWQARLLIPGMLHTPMVPLPNGEVLFVDIADESLPERARATRSGTIVIHRLPSSDFSDLYSYPTMTAGPDGDLWATTGGSSIVRISGLDTVAGDLHQRHSRK